MDDDTEDVMPSEDDFRGYISSEDDVEDGIHPRGDILGNEREKEPFRVTPKHIVLVRSMFSLPPELVTQILDLAEYWFYSQTANLAANRLRDANVQYLRYGPIQGGDFTYPLRRIVITTVSKDQGWSSYPETQGTREGSWTWFELTLDDGKTDDEIARVEIVRNIHAGSEFERYRAVIEDERILKQAKAGDNLSVWARAMYLGWCNHVRSVQIEAWSAC